MRYKYCMELSFSHWLTIREVFALDYGHVLTLAEAVGLQTPPKESPIFSPFKNSDGDPKVIAQQRIAAVRSSYKKGLTGNNDVDIAAAVAGLKPASIIRYDHHPENPAAAFVIDKIKKNPSNNTGAIQAELLKAGIQIRSDFNIIHMNLPGYSTTNIIVGGRKETEELWKLLKCQYYLDFISSDDHSGVTPQTMKQVNDMLHGKCDVFCQRGYAGMDCQPIHKRIGQLLGYTDQEVDDFISSMGGYNHMPDVDYPFELPASLANVPRKKGFVPHESSQYKASTFNGLYRKTENSLCRRCS